MRLLLFLLFIVVAHATSIAGEVVGVTDGDTITVLTSAKESVKVRLCGIDAPEAKQAFWHPRQTGAVHLGVPERGVGGGSELDVNTEMVRRGYTDYAKRDEDLAKAEAEAKNATAGLWAGKRPIAPGDFRKNEAHSKAVTHQSRS